MLVDGECLTRKVMHVALYFGLRLARAGPCASSLANQHPVDYAPEVAARGQLEKKSHAKKRREEALRSR